MNCIHCGRTITQDAAKGGWPLGPVGPVCAKSPAISKHLHAQKVAQRVAQAASPRRRAAALDQDAPMVDPRQMALALEVRC